MKFAIRDVLWLTLVVAVGCAWWMDRWRVAWQRREAIQTIERLRERLDRVEPEWQVSGGGAAVNWPDRNAHAGSGLVLGAILFAVAVLTVVLVWQGRLHWSLLERKRRL